MRDTELYAQIPGLQSPWEVVRVDLDRSSSNVVVQVAPAAGTAFACPTCGQPATTITATLRHIPDAETKIAEGSGKSPATVNSRVSGATAAI